MTHAALPTLALLLGACTHPSASKPDTEATTPDALTATPADTLPAVAPAVILLAQLHADGTVSVNGTVQAELYVDTDVVNDDRYAFRYQVLDGAGTLLYERTASSPIIVRDFLAYYGEISGYDLLTIVPDLGNFPIQVPLLPDAATVNLQIRDDEGVFQDVGHYDLTHAAEDDRGLNPIVTGVESLWESGPPSNRLDIAVLGDGYTVDEIGKFHEDAEGFAEGILSAEPMRGYADQINIWRIDAPSNESGASYDCVGDCDMRDTAYGSVFPIDLVNTVLGTDYRSSAVFQLDQYGVAAAAANVPWDIVVVLVNTEHDGGFAIHYASIPTVGSPWHTTGVHEFGHILGVLGDEYQEDFCIRSGSLGLPENITDNPESPRWSGWIDADTPLPTPDTDAYLGSVGAFEGAYNCPDLYRPSQSCRMLQSSAEDFCPVCTELLTRRIFRFADPAGGVDVATHDDGTLVLTLADPRTDVHSDWAIDGGVVASDVPSLSLAPGSLGEGSHTLEVRTSISSTRVRNSDGDLEQDWHFTVE